MPYKNHQNKMQILPLTIKSMEVAPVNLTFALNLAMHVKENAFLINAKL